MASHFYQITDFYSNLKYPEKYKGTRPLTLRSGWEISFAKWLDINTNVLEWTSESVIIPYLLETDGKMHRYFMDFSFKGKTKEGGVREFWVEVKPSNKLNMPKKPKRVTKGYVAQVNDYIKNQCKWKATRRIVEEERLLGRDLEFLIITEKDAQFFK